MKKIVKKKAVKKRVVRRKKATRKKPATKISRKMVKALEIRIEKQIKKAEKCNAEMAKAQLDMGNPYAPGTWDMRYVYDAKNDDIKPQFFKLSPRARAKNRERILSLPLTHEETVEEVLEQLKFKK